MSSSCAAGSSSKSGALLSTQHAPSTQHAEARVDQTSTLVTRTPHCAAHAAPTHQAKFFTPTTTSTFISTSYATSPNRCASVTRVYRPLTDSAGHVIMSRDQRKHTFRGAHVSQAHVLGCVLDHGVRSVRMGTAPVHGECYVLMSPSPLTHPHEQLLSCFSMHSFAVAPCLAHHPRAPYSCR